MGNAIIGTIYGVTVLAESSAFPAPLAVKLKNAEKYEATTQMRRIFAKDDNLAILPV